MITLFFSRKHNKNYLFLCISLIILYSKEKNILREKISHDVIYCLFQVVLVFILSIASLIIYFIDASR